MEKQVRAVEREREAGRMRRDAKLQAAVVEAVRAELARFETEFEELRRHAITDPLTSLYNRRYFDQSFTREVGRAQRYQRALTLLLLDLDDLKQINDRGGHLAGDAVLT